VLVKQSYKLEFLTPLPVPGPGSCGSRLEGRPQRYGLAPVYQFAGLSDHLHRQFPLAAKFYSPVSCGLHSGEGSFAAEATFQFRQDSDHLPHGSTCRSVRVDCLREGAEFHATGAEVIEHRYQVVQAAVQPVELVLE
jgi:hypothetical protein